MCDCKLVTIVIHPIYSYCGTFVWSTSVLLHFDFFRPFACFGSAPTGWIFVKFDIWGSYENLLRNWKFGYCRTKISGTLREDKSAFKLTAVRIVLLFDNSTTVPLAWQNYRLLHCWQLNVGKQQYKGDVLLRSHCDNGYTIASQCYEHVLYLPSDLTNKPKNFPR